MSLVGLRVYSQNISTAREKLAQIYLQYLHVFPSLPLGAAVPCQLSSGLFRIALSISIYIFSKMTISISISISIFFKSVDIYRQSIFAIDISNRAIKEKLSKLDLIWIKKVEMQY